MVKGDYTLWNMIEASLNTRLVSMNLLYRKDVQTQ